MRKGIILCLACLLMGNALADETKDIFKGKLFPPNVVLEHRSELGISREQFTEIRATVVQTQTAIAEHEWDMQEAYTKVLQLLDERPLDEQIVVNHVNDVLLAENQVKILQMVMLVKIRNLLTDEQIAYLEANWSTK